MKIGEIIKDYCTQHHISQRAFALKAGMSNGYVSQLVRGGLRSGYTTPSKPDLGTLYKIASAMGISLTDLCEMLDNKTAVDLKPAAVSIPVFASVQAGLPLEAAENIVDYEEISPDLYGEYFALKVKGDSMSPRICEGDVVIVKKQNVIENGKVAIVLVNGSEATIKKVVKGKDYITLIGFNPNFDPITYTKEQIRSLPVQIIGKVIEIRGKL